ncbi:MAG TPA: hypothetical protein VGS15_04395 [Candidatus Acidoferrales bacterium]|nr:hypothetical protein [Candidatus Acidoferrales bacterium]
MKTFVSYSTAQDHIIALRLQTLAAVSGMTVYVPPATTRQTWNGVLLPEIQKQLQESDMVLAVITHNPSQSAVNEMNTAVKLKRTLIPIVGENVPLEYYSSFNPHFVVDTKDPSITEAKIVQFLGAKKQQEAATAGIVLGTLALALLLLLASESK